MLSASLKRGVEIGHIETLPCTIKMMKRRKAHRGFYPPDSITRLCAVGNVKEQAVILLGGHAGLRAGEIAGLLRTDLDFVNDTIQLERALWKGIEVAPKNGRGRKIPMTETLKAALLALPIEGDRVLYQDNGRQQNARTLATIVRRLERKAGLPEIGHVHLLRHSFCSNLGASEQVPVRTIMELAGHANLDTTLGYMKLAEHAARLAIRVLDGNGSRQASVPPSQLN
jgi:integrase